MGALGRRHEATLKKLVQHQRTINTDDESPCFEEELDLRDQGILDREPMKLRKILCGIPS